MTVRQTKSKVAQQAVAPPVTKSSSLKRTTEASKPAKKSAKVTRMTRSQTAAVGVRPTSDAAPKAVKVIQSKSLLRDCEHPVSVLRRPFINTSSSYSSKCSEVSLFVSLRSASHMHPWKMHACTQKCTCTRTQTLTHMHTCMNAHTYKHTLEKKRRRNHLLNEQTACTIFI